jgi:DNA-binding XRE family transcriptional regulator
MQNKREKLRYVRKLRRLSQRQVARLIGHGDTTMISKYERGFVAPTLRTAITLALLYRMPIQDLFADEFSHARDELAQKAKTVRMTQQVLF